MHCDAVIDQTNTCILSSPWFGEGDFYFSYVGILAPSFISTFTPKILLLERFTRHKLLNDF